jgi:hypothetical protein
MPEQGLHIDRAKKMLPPPFALPLLAAAQKQFEAFAQAQSELTRKATEVKDRLFRIEYRPAQGCRLSSCKAHSRQFF